MPARNRIHERSSADSPFVTLLDLFEIETDLMPAQVPPLIIIKPEHD